MIVAEADIATNTKVELKRLPTLFDSQGKMTILYKETNKADN